HHGRARHLAEGADMRQAGRAVARLEQDTLRKALLFIARHDLARLLEGPGAALFGRSDEFGREIGGYRKAHDSRSCKGRAGKARRHMGDLSCWCTGNRVRVNTNHAGTAMNRKIDAAHEALIHLMIVAAAADSDMTDAELRRIGDLVRTLPVFDGFDDERL